jgi:hypothetical protein
MSCEKKTTTPQLDLEIQLLELHNWLERGKYQNEDENEISYYFMKNNTLKTILISHSSDTIRLALKSDSCQTTISCFQSIFQAFIEKDTIDIVGFGEDYLIIPPHDTVSCLLKFDFKNPYFDEFWSKEMSIYTEKMIDAPIVSKMNRSDYKYLYQIPNIIFTKAEKIWIYNQQEEAYKINRPK